MPSHDDLMRPLGVREKLSRFFHEEETPYGMAAVRILLPLALLGATLPRWQWSREIYSSDGAPAPLWIGYGFAELLPIFPGAVAVALSTLLILSLFSLSLGWCTRLNAALSCLLYFYINFIDSISTMTKYSVIGTHGLLLLALCPCGAVWSLDSWLKGGRRRQEPVWPGEARAILPRFPAWPRRLLQLHLGLVYFGAAITKIHTPAFFTGEQMQTWMMTRLNFDHPVGEYLSMFPAMLVIFAYIAIIWEITFVFLSWKGWPRVAMLLLGVAFHYGTYLMLGLRVFPSICIAIYFAWLDEGDVARISAVLRRWKRSLSRRELTRHAMQFGDRLAHVFRPRQMPVPSTAAFLVLAAVTITAGIEVEYRLDRYGVRRPEGPHELEKLDSQWVEKMLFNPPVPVKAFDQFVDMQLGSFKIAGIIAIPRTEFKAGEILSVQCGLTQPREDMWVDCQLVDREGKVIEQFGSELYRESIRADYQFRIPTYLESGEYAVVLKKTGKEVLRRKFQVVAAEKRALAN